MKAISICFLLSLYFNGNIVGQEPLPVEKKTYRDKHGNLYVNRKLPIYLQLSNDSSKKAENYLLKSHNTPEHTNPMFFYKEGYNAIRLGQAEDATTNKNVYSREPIEFEVYADSKSPSTEAVGSSSPMVIKRGKTYYGRNFSIRLKGLDNLSGIENIYYSINGRPFQIYSTPIKFEKDKKYTLKYYAADNVGNVEAVKSRSFSIDKSAPVSGFGFKGHKIGDVVSPNAFIVLSSQDSLSGVKHIYYSINSGPEKIYKHPIPVRHFKGGGVM